jgi:beta-lactam-binding protein with PASTA domain
VVRVVADDYVGLPEAEARRRLEDRGLRTAVHRVDNTAGAKGGTVAAVDPTGRLHEGDRVTLQVWREAVVAQPKPPKAKPAHKPKHDGPGKHGPKPKGHKKKGH